MELRALRKPTVEEAHEALFCNRMRHANARLKCFDRGSLGCGNIGGTRHAIPGSLSTVPGIGVFDIGIREEKLAPYTRIHDHSLKLDLVLNIDTKIKGIEAHILPIGPECVICIVLGEPAQATVRGTI